MRPLREARLSGHNLLRRGVLELVDHCLALLLALYAAVTEAHGRDNVPTVRLVPFGYQQDFLQGAQIARTSTLTAVSCNHRTLLLAQETRSAAANPSPAMRPAHYSEVWTDCPYSRVA